MKKRISLFIILLVLGTLPTILNLSVFSNYLDDGLRGLKIIFVSLIFPLIVPPLLYLLFGSRGLLYGSIISMVIIWFFLPFSIPMFIISYAFYISAGLGTAIYDTIQNHLDRTKTKN